MTGAVAAVCLVLFLCACQKPYQPPSAEQQRGATSVAASPITVADAAGESLEVVSSKVAGQDDNVFKVSATLKAKKAFSAQQIVLIAEIVTTKDGKKGDAGTLQIIVPGPWEQGATKEVTLSISRLGMPGERTAAIKWIRDRPR